MNLRSCGPPCRVDALRDSARTSDHRTSCEVEYGTQVALITGRDFLVAVPAFKEILDKLGLDAAFYHTLGESRNLWGTKSLSLAARIILRSITYHVRS